MSDKPIPTPEDLSSRPSFDEPAARSKTPLVFNLVGLVAVLVLLATAKSADFSLAKDFAVGLLACVVVATVWHWARR